MRSTENVNIFHQQFRVCKAADESFQYLQKLMKQAGPEFLTGVEFNQELVLSLTKKKYHRLENSRLSQPSTTI